MSLLTVRDLSHMFGDKLVLKSVDVQLGHAEHVGLIGANGAGKSTFVQILSGITLPDEGRIDWLPGTNIGHLEQHLSLQPGRSVFHQLRTAFQHLYDAEAESQRVAEAMGEAGLEGEALEKLFRRFADLQSYMETQGFYGVEATIERVAAGLGLTEVGLETPVDALSGGQRTKVLLAQLLLQKPEVLLLDEPTNYLDTAHVEWLCDYLVNYEQSFIVVSHDEDFLNRIINVVWHLEHHLINRYPGDLHAFNAAYEMRASQVQVAFRRQQSEIEKLETYIQKNKARASTAKQAKSREKRLEKMERIDKPASLPRPDFRFEAGVQPTGMVLETEALSVGYELPLFPPLTLQLKRGEKIAVTGFNGVGKTTLLKTVLGELRGLGGKVYYGDRVAPAYFEQESKNGRGDVTALEDVWATYPGLSQREVREALARSGLRGEKVFQPLTTLSGGEQAKVRLCHLMLERGNWLILDEPTNHLDTAAKASLRDALIRYDGTVLIVTHEPDFYEGWVTDVWDVEDWRDAQQRQLQR